MLDPKNCQPGHEQHETFYAKIIRDTRVQYDYRTPDGTLYSCIAKTLEQARYCRDLWLAKLAQAAAEG